MAAPVLCRRVPRLRHLPGLRKASTQAQLLRIRRADETADQTADGGALQRWEAALRERYRLYYNPNSYYSVCNSAASLGQTENDEDDCLATLAPSFWRQSNRYSVSCSRYLSSSNSTHLDLAFDRGTEPPLPSESQSHGKPIPPDVKVNARAFLKCRPGYASMSLDLTQRPHPIEWDEAVVLLQKVAALRGAMKPSDVCQFFAALSHLRPDRMSLLRSDQRLIILLRYSVEHLRLFTTPQLMELLQSCAWLDLPSAHTVLGQYEAELCRRSDQMSLHQLLLAADWLSCIRKHAPQFFQHLYVAVRAHLRTMEVPELVHLVYLMGEGRKCPADLILPLEQLLMLHLRRLHPEEVGTVCLGLFKSQTSISEGAVTRLVDKAHSFVEEMSDFAMVNVLKYLRFSYLFHRAWLEAMAREVPRRAHRMGVKGLMHVALACSALHCRNDKILTAIAESVPPLLPHCRSKDSCKLLWAFGTLVFHPAQSPSFYASLTEGLRHRKVEFQQYPEHLLSGLLGLIFVAQFPEDLIALALSPEYVNLALKYKQLDLRKDLFTLDGAVALELPQWTGPRLSGGLREEVAEMLWKFAKSDVCQKPEVQEAESALRDLLGGEQFVWKRMILPHTRSIDLEVHLDAAGQPVPVHPASNPDTLALDDGPSKVPSPQGWRRMSVGVTITGDLLAQLTNKNATEHLSTSAPVKPASLHRVEPEEGGSLFDTGLVLTSDLIEALSRPHRPDPAPHDSDGTVKLAIQVCNRNHYCCRSQQLLGFHVMKRRQLKLAGYRVVELDYHEWFPMLRRSRMEKLAYLHCKIYNSLQ